jgi:hypothetical protein
VSPYEKVGIGGGFHFDAEALRRRDYAEFERITGWRTDDMNIAGGGGFTGLIAVRSHRPMV